MRRDERLTIRADLVHVFPDGIPNWMIPIPVKDVLRLMRMREEGYTLLGLDPGDDVEDLFH